MMLDRSDMIDRYRVEDRATPMLRANFISSLDGAATENGRSGGLGNADDKLVFDTLRLLADVIVVGAGTVRVEGYTGVRLSAEDETWRTDHGLAAQPPVAVVSAELDFDPAHPFFAQSVTRPILIVPASAPAPRRERLSEVADVLVCGAESLDAPEMIAQLAARGLAQVLCEGGPHLFGSLVAVDCVDELCLTLSPKLEGGPAGRISRGGPQATREMELVHAIPAGDMLFLRYRRRR
jgi:riboflavin biosynthesis pyrimidine reductase